MIAPIRKAVAAAFSVGPGYEPKPRNPRATLVDVRGYPLDYSAKLLTPATEPLGPVSRAQRALAWWERSLDGDADAQRWFLATADDLVARGSEDGDALRWYYREPVEKYRLEPGWCSAMAQGQIASVLVRAHGLTEQREYAVAALRAVEPLLTPTELVVETSDGPVLEEAPSTPPSLILNGWIYALWGLREIGQALGDERASTGWREGVACLARRLRHYDTGWWSRYSLSPRHGVDLAKPFYHRLHVEQLAVMHELTGEPVFRETAERWCRYDRPPAPARAVVAKAIELASRRVAGSLQ